ncbi:MAG: DNA internalization-related competence protein ComEC/Rec2 [Deltaproteobacteria bacterium]|nr:DNA internalization-related competence protein ComEC/Rec2 [Deltaproteobacteria bacterium]
MSTSVTSESMQPGGDGSDSRGFLIRNPPVWLIAPTVFLLLGQAAVVSPVDIPRSLLAFFLLPAVFLLWRRARVWTLLILLSSGAFCLGYFRHHRVLYPVFPANHLRSIMNEISDVYVEGFLFQEPEKLPQRTRWNFQAERVWHPTGAQEVAGKILVTVRRTEREWNYGDRIRFWVRPAVPRSAGNPGSFDYASFLARREIYVTGFLESDRDVEFLGRGQSAFWLVIETIRRKMRAFIANHFSAVNGALMNALVVGEMGGIARETRDQFTAAGVNHVLSISGLHVAMLGLVVFFVIRFAGAFSETVLLRWNLLKVSAFFSFLAVLFYTALAGAMVPTVRSAIMIGVYELAVLMDREEELFSSLALAALLISLVWPGVVMDISFQLSFLAVLFIVWGLRKVQEWWPPRRREQLLPQERSWLRPKLRQLTLQLVVPVLATLGTGPMIAYYFGQLSLAGFISNPIIVPVVGFLVVPLGLGIGLLSLFSPTLAGLAVGLAERFLAFTIWLVEIFSSLPFSTVSVPRPNFLEVAWLFLTLLAALALRRKSHLLLVLAVLFFAALGDGLYWRGERWHRKRLRVTQLSVGHGDAAVVEFPGSRVLIIDAGGTATGEFDTGEFIVAPFLRLRKILRPDYLLLSHPRVDHYGGMQRIVEEFSPTEFWTGPSQGKTARYQALEDAVAKAGVRRVILRADQPCRSIEQVEICFLYPPEDKEGETSAVVRLRLGEASFLFAGDIEKKDEKLLLQRSVNLSSAVIKVPRHGSLTSSTEEFVAAVRPRLAVFSVSDRGRSGLPRDEVVSRYRTAGAEILRTDVDGAVTIETDGKILRYRTYRTGKKGEIRF